ncbi:NIPSNAP family protein [Xanthomonas arboricola]|uniref:NIPSNAP family protein n=1 Tax=Xanthomonas arboricola TaxID=56448 RepID=UPI0019D1A721|nr:NIPSNAP family protein [Xanthomonas arboricola]
MADSLRQVVDPYRLANFGMARVDEPAGGALRRPTSRLSLPSEEVNNIAVALLSLPSLVRCARYRAASLQDAQCLGVRPCRANAVHRQ